MQDILWIARKIASKTARLTPTRLLRSKNPAETAVVARQEVELSAGSQSCAAERKDFAASDRVCMSRRTTLSAMYGEMGPGREAFATLAVIGPFSTAVKAHA